MTTPDSVAVLEPGYADYRTEAAILAPRGLKIVPVGADVAAGPALVALDPVAVMVRERPVTAALIAACPRLRVIVRYGVGVDNIDLAAARDARVAVANIPDYGAEHEVSDHAMALYLAVQRRIVSRDGAVRAGRWGIGQTEPIPARDGATLGLIGYGRIGRATAAKFRAFGVDRVLVHDPNVAPSSQTPDGAIGADIDKLCAEADILSLHAPLNPRTRHILNATRIRLMKPGAIVINVSRGGLVDEGALAAALTSGHLFGAGIDVFETEPPCPDNPLLAAPNTVISDHTGWYSERSVRALQSLGAAEVLRVLDGQPPQNWVNRW